MKAILILDEMPEACNKCEFYRFACFFDGRLHGTCKRTDEYVNPEEVTTKRSDRCPLKPLPERLYYSDADKRYVDGWTDCLEAILGEEE